MTELRVLTPIGMLGYGVPKDDVERACAAGVDAIVVDSGSTDPGPYLLALDRPLVPEDAYERDLAVLLGAARRHGVPLLIGSAGGAGTAAGVALLRDIVLRLAHAEGWRPKVATITADVPAETLRGALVSGHVVPCGAAPPLAEADVDATVRLVAQMGAEPLIEALKADPDVVIAGRAYDPAPLAALAIRAGIDEATAWHAGKITECGAVCAEPKGKAILATIRSGSFDLEPVAEAERCTPLSVAAHSFYEKSRPDRLAGPGHVVDLTDVRYEPLSDRAVRVSGAAFERTPYEVKVEGARVVGHRAVFIGAVRDPVLIGQLDALFDKLRFYLGMTHAEVASGEAQVRFRRYGVDGVMGAAEPHRAPAHEVAILGEVVAPTCALALSICSTARVATLHAPYEGQLSTGGNVALPLSPSELDAGPACAWTVYHLMATGDPLALFPVEVTSG